MNSNPPPYPYTPGDVPPLLPSTAPRPKRSSGQLGIAIVLAMLAFCLLGVVAVVVTGISNDAREPGAAPLVSTTAAGAAESPAAVAKPAVAVLRAGTYETAGQTNATAGKIAPGKWRIKTPPDGVNCYWARLANFDGQIIGSIIANGNVAPGATAIVNVKKSDAGLELAGDCRATP